jgi:hypothetical protein
MLRISAHAFACAHNASSARERGATTADELEEFGADAAGAGPNAARVLVDAVRRRKGLPVEEKVVAFATKQRTQARKR